MGWDSGPGATPSPAAAPGEPSGPQRMLSEPQGGWTWRQLGVSVSGTWGKTLEQLEGVSSGEAGALTFSLGEKVSPPPWSLWMSGPHPQASGSASLSQIHSVYNEAAGSSDRCLEQGVGSHWTTESLERRHGRKGGGPLLGTGGCNMRSETREWGHLRLDTRGWGHLGVRYRGGGHLRSDTREIGRAHV